MLLRTLAPLGRVQVAAMGLWDKLTQLLSPAASPAPRLKEPTSGELTSPARPGIVIWDLENCSIPAGFSNQLPAIVRALRTTSGASRVVTAVATPVPAAVNEQLQLLLHCDVEVLTVMRPQRGSISEKKHSSADYLLKRVWLRCDVFVWFTCLRDGSTRSITCMTGLAEVLVDCLLGRSRDPDHLRC